MTTIRLEDGSRFLHSPVELDDETRSELKELGPVRHAVAPNKATISSLARTGRPTDVQLDRALEALKSWTYFERLKQGREAGFLQARARKTAP